MPFDSTNYYEEPKVVRDLRAARAYLVEHGWCQSWEDPDGRVCALGAIRMTKLGTTLFMSARASAPARIHETIALEILIGKQVPLVRGRGNRHSVVGYNDSTGRTFEEILALFDGAIAQALQDEVVAA